MNYIFNNHEELKNAVNLWSSDIFKALFAYGNISRWDVSNVTSMDKLFCYKSHFNGDISKWRSCATPLALKCI